MIWLHRGLGVCAAVIHQIHGVDLVFIECHPAARTGLCVVDEALPLLTEVVATVLLGAGVCMFEVSSILLSLYRSVAEHASFDGM